MARETKQDRIVRNMFDSASESLHQLQALIKDLNVKETDVESWCNSVLRTCLGYTATNGYSIKAQEAKGKMRPDLIIYQGEKPVIVVEVKKLGFDLKKSDFRSGKLQLSEYLKLIGNVRWGILCNGYEWKLIDYAANVSDGVEVLSFDLRDDQDQIDVSKRGVDENSYEFLGFHESAFKGEEWDAGSREALAFSPESLAKAILSVNTVKYIAKEIRGEHDYKANVEALLDKVSDLLSRGLDDTVPGWNEQRQVEMNKYVTSQKRAGRRTRKKQLANASISDPVAVQPESGQVPPEGQISPKKVA